MKLNRAERLYYHAPFWGLDGATPDVKLGDDSWTPMILASAYDPGPSWNPPSDVVGSPTWYRILLAGPDATGNPMGTIVVTGNPTRLQLRVIAGDEIDILPNTYNEWIHLT